MKKKFIAVAGLPLMTALFNAHAGPDGMFLCNSAAPYDFLTADAPGYQRFGILRNGRPLTEAGSGALIAGQGVKAISAQGLMVVPGGIGDHGWIELRKQGRLLRKIPGWIQFWDSWTNGSREKFIFSVWKSATDTPSGSTASQARYIVDGDGQIRFEQHYERPMAEEDFGAEPLFTADGEALYEQAADPLTTVNLYSAADFHPIGKVEAPEGGRLDKLAMLTATSGFAISNGRIHRFAQGELRPITLQLTTAARSIEVDTRARRILIGSANDFIVMDLTGTVLYHFASRRAAGTHRPASVQARLAIDGSVAFIGDDDPATTVLLRKSGYSQARAVPLAADDWNRVACFTPNSAALLVDDKPLLVKF